MSEEAKSTSTEANSTEEKLEQSTTGKVEAEESKEKKEAERPGVCCGSCS